MKIIKKKDSHVVLIIQDSNCNSNTKLGGK
jgi:hypothetical protein